MDATRERDLTITPELARQIRAEGMDWLLEGTEDTVSPSVYPEDMPDWLKDDVNPVEVKSMMDEKDAEEFRAKLQSLITSYEQVVLRAEKNPLEDPIKQEIRLTRILTLLDVYKSMLNTLNVKGARMNNDDLASFKKIISTAHRKVSEKTMRELR
jgi:hypothetical protein